MHRVNSARTASITYHDSNIFDLIEPHGCDLQVIEINNVFGKEALTIFRRCSDRNDALFMNISACFFREEADDAIQAVALLAVERKNT